MTEQTRIELQQWLEIVQPLQEKAWDELQAAEKAMRTTKEGVTAEQALNRWSKLVHERDAIMHMLKEGA